MSEFSDKRPPKPIQPVKKTIPLQVYLNQEPVKSDLEYEYGREILDEYYEKEFAIEQNFLNKQAEFSYKHRAILIDWMHSTHCRFKLQIETLFLSINILDRYLSVKSIRVSQMQLLGITALFLACKYEEIYSPDLNEMLSTADNAFLKDQVVLLEKDILNVLDFAITKPNSLKFYYRYAENFELTGSLFSFGLYLLELSFDHRVVKHKPSVVAMSSVILTHVLFHKDLCRLRSMVLIDVDIKSCISDIAKVLEFARENPLKSVWDKYSKRKNHCVSSLTLL